MSIKLKAATLLVFLMALNKPNAQQNIDKVEPVLPKQGWQKLFNSKDFNHWQHIGEGKFVIEEGLLRTEGSMGLLWYTPRKFGNCILRVIYKVNSAEANSGVFVRIANEPKDAWDAVHNGYEIQIADTGIDVKDAFHSTGAIYSFSKAKSPPPTSAIGNWNTLDIFLYNTKIIVYLNGHFVSSFDDTLSSPPPQKTTDPKRGHRPTEGYIGLQNHDDQEDLETHVWFKEVSVHNLS